MDLRSAFEMAKKIELEGKEFYGRAKREAKNQFVSRIFLDLESEEEVHIRVIERIYEQITGKGRVDEWITSTRGRTYVFDPERIEEAIESKDDLEALKLALSFEEKSINFYEERASESDDPKLKRFFLTLSYEERGHYLRIMDSIQFLLDPSSFLMQKERSMRDGG